MAYALRSEVRKIVHPRYKMIIATDGTIGKRSTRRDIEVLCEKGGSFEEVSELVVEKQKSTESDTKLAVLISAGMVDISLQYWGLNPGLVRGREDTVRKELVEDLVEKLRRFQAKISMSGSIVVFASLIPNPREQIKLEHDIAKHSRVKVVLREVYIQCTVVSCIKE